MDNPVTTEDVIQTCPKCQSSNSSIKDLKFLVSYCGHSICVKCFELMFQRNEENCPKCDEKLPRSSFRPRMFDSDRVESYMCYHQEVKRIYNCDETDFETEMEYNDYLEDVENLIYELMDKDTRDEARIKMREYYSANKVEIKKRRNRKDKDLEFYHQWKRQWDSRRAEVNREELEEKMRRDSLDKEFTRRLISSDEPLDEVMQEYSRVFLERQVATRAGDSGMVDRDGPALRSPSKPFRYERPPYMVRSPFRHERSRHALNDDANFTGSVLDEIATELIMQTLRRPAAQLPACGGGFTSNLWLHRLRHFTR